MAADRDAAHGALDGVVGHADAAVVEEACHGRPSLQAVIHDFGKGVLGRGSSALLAQPFFEIVDELFRSLAADDETLLRREPVDLMLDGEQGVDAFDRFYCDRRLLQLGSNAPLRLQLRLPPKPFRPASKKPLQPGHLLSPREHHQLARDRPLGAPQ